MRIISLYKAFKSLIGGLCFLLMAGFLFSSLLEVNFRSNLSDSLANIPNYNYTQDIRKLQKEGKLSEALEIARFVIKHEDMPGQLETRQLAEELEKEITSLWRSMQRATKGFITGSGNSIEELSGGIASDMIIYGDVRDLVKQGYYKITGKDTDTVVAALAGIGLMTEVVDIADWVPAVLKAFRKIGALSKQFADFVILACKKTVKTLKLDGVLKTALKNLEGLVDKMGLARTAAVFKHVDTPSDLSAIAKTAEKNVDAAYFTVKNGGVDILKQFDATDAGVNIMKKAAKKGPRGIAWLRKGGSGYKYVIRTRITARLLKNLRLERPQKFVKKIAKEFPTIKILLWAITLVATFLFLFLFFDAGRKFHKVIKL
ncbi:hypothetical protein QUF70_04640 [Desulfobacterales bacterium HSG17]|nr:hypothetical protein [Desulfobacterales bacterium HSG17]